MSRTPPLASVAISGRMTINLHSLNNEGAEGNQMQTRMVHIVDGGDRITSVNGISGDMFKHIQAEHFHGLATAAGTVPLCAGCQKFSANRINEDRAFIDPITKEHRNDDILDGVIQRCAMDDVEGILITAGNRSMPRKSTVEFGWVVGLPEVTRTESYLHTKYDVAQSRKGSGDQSGANLGQNIFYRPASSGVYAAVVNADLYRVGWNDITQRYVIADDDRRQRQKMLLESLLYTFIKPAGAHRNTQHPHMTAFSGIVTCAYNSIPAPVVSALADDYAEQIESIVAGLQRIAGHAVEAHRFASLGDLTGVMVALLETL